MKTYIGIDPGKRGAIVCLQEKELTKFIIPLTSNFIDISTLDEIFSSFENEDAHIIIEDVHALFGSSASATFSFGYCVGLLEGLIVAHKLSYTKVQPKEWQKLCFQGVTEIRKPFKKNKKGVLVKGKLDTKAMAAIAAKRLFPKEDFRITQRCKNLNDGLIDATLLAYYGKTKQL